MKILVLSLIVSLPTVACEPTSDQKMKHQTERSMLEANAQIGMPGIVNFQERKLAKMIFELRDKENLITYAYIVNHMTGQLVFIGQCIGFGLPYSVQYTNPEKYHHSGATLPQADPNGLFMPQGLSATWLMMVDPKGGDPRPVYVEPEILVSPFPLHSDGEEK
jgi:hypothetical protein